MIYNWTIAESGIKHHNPTLKWTIHAPMYNYWIIRETVNVIKWVEPDCVEVEGTNHFSSKYQSLNGILDKL